MKIKLRTDFKDYYDHWFCYDHEKPHAVFHRMTTYGMNRIEMFKFFADNDCRAPINGYVKDIKNTLLQYYGKKLVSDLNDIGVHVIVYTNINSHAGEGKLKCTYQYALENYPDNYCSLFINNNYDKPTSTRILTINTRSFILKYESDDLWRSNCGNVDISVLAEVSFNKFFHQQEKFPHPLYAIDLVPGVNENDMYAVDLNIAPCIKGSGLENILLGHDIYELIEDFYKHDQ